MVAQPQNKKIYESIKSLYSTFHSLISEQSENISRTGRDFDFTNSYQLIKDVYYYLNNSIKKENFWLQLNTNEISNIKSNLEKLVNHSKEIIDFKLNSDSTTVHQNLTEYVRSTYNSLKKNLIDNYILFNNNEEIEKIKNRPELKEFSQNLEETRKIKEEAQEVLDTIRNISGQVGIEKYAVIFEKEADKNLKNSKWVRGIAIGLIILCFGIIISLLWYNINNDLDSETKIDFIISKLAILSLLYISIYQIFKSFNSYKHLEALNRHRQNAVNVFRKFYEAPEDPEIKNAILLQATKCIFDQSDTGFVSSKDSNTSGNEIINILGKGLSKVNSN